MDHLARWNMSELQKLYNRKYYEKNITRRKADSVAYKLETRKIVNGIKISLGCYKCGEKDHRCLDFHHRVPEEKSFEIAFGLQRGLARQRVFAEIQKCDVMCSNCHRKEHFALVI